MHTKVIVLTLSVLLGIAASSSAMVASKVNAPKIPKLIHQNAKAFILVARDNYYSPRYVEVKVRSGSVISIENKGANTHGLIIPAFSYQGVIQPGRIKKIVVPKKSVGVYEFYCPYHKGMRGTIEIF
jgi:plastocyanin